MPEDIASAAYYRVDHMVAKSIEKRYNKSYTKNRRAYFLSLMNIEKYKKNINDYLIALGGGLSLVRMFGKGETKREPGAKSNGIFEESSATLASSELQDFRKFYKPE